MELARIHSQLQGSSARPSHLLDAETCSTSTSIIYSQQSFMIITGRRMSGCYTCYKIKMDCIDL